MMNRLFNRRQPVVDVNAVLAENHALQQEIAQLREQLADYEHNYNNLRQWADEASVRLKAYRAKEQS
jgi:cell division septum initiation protein DivIVA